MSGLGLNAWALLLAIWFETIRKEGLQQIFLKRERQVVDNHKQDEGDEEDIYLVPPEVLQRKVRIKNMEKEVCVCDAATGNVRRGRRGSRRRTRGAGPCC